MTYFTGTLLASPIVNGSSIDTYGTHYSVLGVGGYSEVATIADRNAIPVNVTNGLDYDGLSSGRRRLGMLVYVSQTNIIYQLNIPYSTWIVLSSSNKVAALANDSNWIIYSSGSGAGSGQNVTTTITKLSHGFTVGQPIAFSGNTYVKAIADGSVNGIAIGIVSSVYDINTFGLTQSGFLSGLTGFVTNSTYYVSDNVAGILTTTIPTINGHITQPIFIATSAISGWVLPYRPFLISSGGSTIYNLSSPAAVTVGGIIIGTILTGKTSNQLLEEILVPELFQTVVTAPNISIGLSPSGVFEIGCVITTLSVIGTFSRGAQTPAYCGCLPFRTGAPNAYSFTGTQMPVGFQACTAGSAIRTATNYSVLSGSQTWGVCTSYNAGQCPVGSKGTPNSSIACCPAGTTAAVNSSISGILPWYWGLSTSGIVNGTCVAFCGYSGGGKCVAPANVTLSIIFNSSASDYIWFAVPQGTPVKTCWYVNGTNNGCIGGVGNLFATSCTVAVTSGQGCWTGCNYQVYVSCTPTGTAAGVPMCMS